MNKKLRSFSEKISTGKSFREVTIAQGTPEWQKLKKDIEKWKKKGGTLKAKLKGKKVPVTKGFTKAERRKFRGAGFPVTEINAVEKLKISGPKKGYTRYTNPKKWVEGGDAWHIIKMWGFVDLDQTGFVDQTFKPYSENPRVPAGNNYHPAVGWY